MQYVTIKTHWLVSAPSNTDSGHLCMSLGLQCLGSFKSLDASAAHFRPYCLLNVWCTQRISGTVTLICSEKLTGFPTKWWYLGRSCSKLILFHKRCIISIWHIPAETDISCTYHWVHPYWDLLVYSTLYSQDIFLSFSLARLSVAGWLFALNLEPWNLPLVQAARQMMVAVC